MDLRSLPSTDALASELAEGSVLPRRVVVDVCRTAIDEARKRILEGSEADAHRRASERIADLEAARPTQVINATGVLLHTNLGRSNLPLEASSASSAIASAASNVEVDPRTGRRSGRHDYLGPALSVLTGAEAAIAVNNNAGALLLTLASIGAEARIAVSRGELIEIGGSFRLPELMAASGAELVEVGTTNRTRLSDYGAVLHHVDAILKVHPSNYRVEGFQEDTASGELASLARRHGIPFIHDVGSGLIDADVPWLTEGSAGWLADEPGVRQSITEGADLVLFSGDKLFGGPQAGIIVGRAEAVARASAHPIARAVRLDGAAIAALTATTEMYLDDRVADIPFWAMASATASEIEQRARRATVDIDEVTLVPGASVPGAGSVPGETIPTMLIEIPGNAEEIWQSLASDPNRVIATRRDGKVYLDLRSVLPSDDDAVRSALQRVVG